MFLHSVGGFDHEDIRFLIGKFCRHQMSIFFHTVIAGIEDTALLFKVHPIHARSEYVSGIERRKRKSPDGDGLVIIDEFAALKTEVPEFVDGLVDIAQRGRSMGVHMILATQKPSGVITGQIDANTNLRVALRVASAAESQDVLGSREAAEISAR